MRWPDPPPVRGRLPSSTIADGSIVRGDRLAIATAWERLRSSRRSSAKCRRRFSARKRSTGSSSAYRKRLAARRRVVPADDDGRLQRRIGDLDRQIDQGVKRVLTAPEAVVGMVYAEIEKLRQERDRLQADLDGPRTAGDRHHGNGRRKGRGSGTGPQRPTGSVYGTPHRRRFGTCSLRSSRRSSYILSTCRTERRNAIHSSTGRSSSVLSIRCCPSCLQLPAVHDHSGPGAERHPERRRLQ